MVLMLEEKNETLTAAGSRCRQNLKYENFTISNGYVIKLHQIACRTCSTIIFHHSTSQILICGVHVVVAVTVVISLIPLRQQLEIGATTEATTRKADLQMKYNLALPLLFCRVRSGNEQSSWSARIATCSMYVFFPPLTDRYHFLRSFLLLSLSLLS